MGTRKPARKPARPRTAAHPARDGERPARFDAATKRRLRFLAGFAAYFAAVWLLWNTPVVYPLKVFVVLLHEVSHGIAAIAGGGAIRSIVLTFDQGGACNCPGGNPFVTLSAGYLGSMGWGALLLVLATGPARRHRLALATIGALLAAMTALYVRNIFGLAFGLAAGFALLGAARYLTPALNRPLLTVLGLTSCLYAMLDIKSDILERPELRSDARMLAELTGVPTLVWGVLWISIAAAIGWLLFRRSFAKA